MIANQTRIRSLISSDLPEMNDIPYFNYNIETVAVQYIILQNRMHLVQITTHEIIVILLQKSLANIDGVQHFSLNGKIIDDMNTNESNIISFCELIQNYLVMIVVHPTSILSVNELLVFEFGKNDCILELIHKKSLESAISALSIFVSDGVLSVVMCSYDGYLYCIDFQAQTKMSRIELKPLYFDFQAKIGLKSETKISLFDNPENNIEYDEEHKKEYIQSSLFDMNMDYNESEMENKMIAQSMLFINFDACAGTQFFVGTRDGYLMQYSIENPFNVGCIAQQMQPIVRYVFAFFNLYFVLYFFFDRNIGVLPVDMFVIDLDIDHGINNLNNYGLHMSEMCGTQALLCIAEQTWILFCNKKQEFELWPLQYLEKKQRISYASSFIRMFYKYLHKLKNYIFK